MLNDKQVAWLLQKEQQIRTKYPIKDMLTATDDMWKAFTDDVEAFCKATNNNRAVVRWMVSLCKEYDARYKIYRNEGD